MKIFIFALSCLFFSSNSFATPREVTEGNILREVPMNQILGKGLTGKTSRFSTYRGKPLIINVWASWCGPCRNEMGSLEQLSKHYGGKQFNIIGISTDDDASAAAAAIKSAKLTFSNYLDHDLILENMLGADTIPLTILVDKNGRVLKKIRGSQAWDNATSIKLIEETFQVNLALTKSSQKTLEKK